MVIYNIPRHRLPKDETTKTPFTTLEDIIACEEGKTQGKSTRSLSGRQPENKKPSVKGTPLMATSQAPDLTMTHADSLHYQPTQGCGNFVYKILVLEHQMPSRTNYFCSCELCVSNELWRPVFILLLLSCLGRLLILEAKNSILNISFSRLVF
jgi:hypothetical protein